MSKPTLVILAAGMGSRYGGLKQISRFGPSGETITEYSIFDALRAGFGKIVLVVRESFVDEFRKTVLHKAMEHADISFVYQELENLPEGFHVPPSRVKPWGTAHAVMMAATEVNTPFAVINADDFYGADAYKVLANFLSRPGAEDKPEEYCMVDYLLKNTLSKSGSVARGICEVDAGGFLTGIVEHKNIAEQHGKIYSEMPDKTQIELTGNEHVSMNMMGFLPSFFTYLKAYFEEFLQKNLDKPGEEFYLPYALNRVISEGRAKAKVLTTHARWFGVTYAADKEVVIESLRSLTEQGAYPADLWTSD